MRRAGIAALALLSFLLLRSPAARAEIVTTDLARRIATVAPGEDLPVLVRFADRVDLAAFPRRRSSAPGLIRALRATAARSQATALALLRAEGHVSGTRSLWIDNVLAVRVTGGLLDRLSRLPGVERIEYDEPVGLADAVHDAPSVVAGSGWNIIQIRAPEAWSTYGYDGSGVVIGSMDTGADVTHPAIAGKWRGGSHSWLDLVNDGPAPYDDHGHGTHTIGTLVGGDGPGPLPDDVGVAPGARFISAKVLDAGNSFSSASIVLAGAQWMLDPDGNPDTDDFPQVVCNSWYFYNQTYTGFHAAAEAWRSAGIVPVFCIGNGGPGAGTTYPPGNYDDVIGVGATDVFDAIAGISSRGPSPAGAGFPADGRKPDLSAPGVNVYSSIPGGGYQSWTGTSMATPHVAGTIALMLQAAPELTYDEIRSYLLSTSVDLGVAGYDHGFGYGRLDAAAAVVRPKAEVPAGTAALSLLETSPNPSSGVVSFRAAASAGDLALTVYDVQGRRLCSTRPGAGVTLSWDGRDEQGTRVPPGVYLARVSDGRSSRTLRIVRLP